MTLYDRILDAGAAEQRAEQAEKYYLGQGDSAAYHGMLLAQHAYQQRANAIKLIDWQAIRELVEATDSAICQLVEGIEFEPCGVVADRVAKQLCAGLKRIKGGE